MTLQEIGALLRDERKKRGLSQMRVAEELGYYQRDISEIELASRNVYFRRVQEYANLVGLEIQVGPLKGDASE